MLKNTKSNIEELEEILQYKFKNKKLLQEALIHRSYANENNKEKNNERLEFLGDAVVDLVTTEYLYHKYPHFNEGILTKIQSQIVSEKMLSNISRNLNLGKFLKLSKGENQLGGREKDSILGDTFETIMGAMYLDGGFEVVKEHILKYLKLLMDNFEKFEELKDYKTELQEFVQCKYATLPMYILINDYGPDHSKLFEIEVYVDNKKCGHGFARSKKEAEKIAAKQALEKMVKE